MFSYISLFYDVLRGAILLYCIYIAIFYYIYCIKWYCTLLCNYVLQLAVLYCSVLRDVVEE